MVDKTEDVASSKPIILSNICLWYRALFQNGIILKRLTRLLAEECIIFSRNYVKVRQFGFDFTVSPDSRC